MSVPVAQARPLAAVPMAQAQPVMSQPAYQQQSAYPYQQAQPMQQVQQMQPVYQQPYPQQVVVQQPSHPQVVMAPQPQVVYRQAGPAVQNSTGPVSVGLGSIAVDLPGQAPVVQHGTEHRTIAVQSTMGCCYRSQFYPHYEAGKLSLSAAEFQGAVQEINEAAAPAITCFCCCCYCNKCKFDQKCQELTQRYADRRVQFYIHTKYQMTMYNTREGPRMGTRGRLNLIVVQN